MSARRNRFFWNTRFLRAALPAALLLALMNPAAPQTFDGSAIGLQQLLQQQQTGNIDQVPQAQSGPAIQTYRPQSDSSQPSPVSALERIYSDRVGHKISQFGYDVLGGGATIQVAQAGGIQDNYVLGVGDQVVVVLRGPENATYSQRVNRLGQVVLPRLPPVAAAGRTFGDFRSDIEARVAQAFVSTQAFVSLGEVRQVSVLVSGAVRNPGSRIISALASPLDAILLSGGITKAGSLRGIVIEGGGRSRTVDLYGVLSHAGTKSLGTLVDGDRIFVPPLGKTVAISGGVRSAGIFEIPRGANSITASQLVDLAGGLLLGGGARFSQLRLEASGQGRVVPATENTSLHEGEKIGRAHV